MNVTSPSSATTTPSMTLNSTAVTIPPMMRMPPMALLLSTTGRGPVINALGILPSEAPGRAQASKGRLVENVDLRASHRDTLEELGQRVRRIADDQRRSHEMVKAVFGLDETLAIHEERDQADDVRDTRTATHWVLLQGQTPWTLYA